MERYKIIRKLGEGGSGIAYLAMDREKKIPVTLKCIKPGAMHSARETFEHEVKILKALREFIRIGLFEDAELPYLIDETESCIVIKYIAGTNLLDYMMVRRRLKEKEVISISLDIIAVLRKLHESPRPIVFRDLKPSNIIIKKDGHAALIDFGAARFYKKNTDAEDTVNLGTCGYAAPEQYGCLGQTDEQTDIYCLGMTMLQLLSGANLKDCECVSTIRSLGIKNVSNELLNVIEGCIKADRNSRYKSFIEVEEQIRSIFKRKFVRRSACVASAVLLAAVISLTVSNLIVYAMPIRDAAVSGFEKRMPSMQQRLMVARQWIEQYAEKLGVELKFD